MTMILILICQKNKLLFAMPRGYISKFEELSYKDLYNSTYKTFDLQGIIC